MDLYNKKDLLIQSFEELRKHGYVKNWTDFADILGVNRSVLSAAKNGDEKYLTDTLMAKVKAAHELHFAPPTETEIEQEMVLVIPTGARAGTLADFAIQVTGDSMSPEYPSGSVILIKKINEKAFIEWGKTYVLDTENGAVIKNIRRTDNPDIIECVSLNPAYQPFTMETRYVNGWYRVLMVLSLK